MLLFFVCLVNVTAYVKSVHVYRLKTEVEGPGKGYFKLPLPGFGEERMVNPCTFIKPVWTKNKESALTSFKVIYDNKQTSQNSKEDKEMVNLDKNRRIVATYNPKDDAKAEEIELKSKRMVNADGVFWSCTENIGSRVENDSCAKNAFLCWKWRKNDTGKE